MKTYNVGYGIRDEFVSRRAEIIHFISARSEVISLGMPGFDSRVRAFIARGSSPDLLKNPVNLNWQVSCIAVFYGERVSLRVSQVARILQS